MRRPVDNWPLLLFLGASLLAWPVAAQERDEEAGAIREQGRSVNAGYVVLDGRYLPSPYVPERCGDDLLINGQMALRGRFASMGDRFAPEGRSFSRGGGTFHRGGGGAWNRGGGREGGGPAGRGPAGNQGFWESASLHQIERLLEDGTLLLGGDTPQGLWMFRTNAVITLDILLSSAPPDAKLERIRQEGFDHMNNPRWQEVIASFEPSAELAARIAPLVKEYRQVEENNLAEHRARLAGAFFESRPAKYLITLTAMGLVVAACGTLLNYRPQGRARWSEVDTEGEGIPIVVRNVVLLVLLGVFDLGCTLVAQQAGGFTELNPLGHHVLSNSFLLTGFKLSTLFLACAILYALRRYRGAQVAAWWMCLLCTVLAFRWLTYNSMFMA